MKILKNKKIAVLGLGVNNMGLVNFLLKNELSFTVCDRDIEAKNKYSELAAISTIDWQIGDNYLKGLENFDIIFRTPGIPYFTPEIQQAKQSGVEISSQTKLFFDLCPCGIIGVSGTKGKGTTTTLIYEILKIAGKDVYLAGNIGRDPFDYLDQLKKDSLICLELSSFQLQDLHKSPHIGIVLNISEDHLDHHKSRDEYVEAKTSLVKHQTEKDFSVINYDYETSRSFADLSRGKKYFFSRNQKVDQGVFVKNGQIVLALNSKEIVICKTSDIELIGKHNWENVMAASAASYLAGALVGDIKNGIKSFKGLEHRIEFVAEKDGISFYNDSFSTVPDAAITAIESFDKPIILICGGHDKGADFEQLGRKISNYTVKAVILIGRTAEKIKKEILKQVQDDKNVEILEGAQNMAEIMKQARSVAKSGDIVLLSPACASFGMFKNYKDRGNQFKEFVRKKF